MIGPRKFGRQPSLFGASSVPELLEQGGTEAIRNFPGGSVIAQYVLHPFVGPTLPIAERKFRDLIEREPL